METAAQLAQNDPERHHLQRLADELTTYGWECALQGNRLKVTNPRDSGLTDQVVCRSRDDGWHYAFAFHKARTFGHVDQVVAIARRIIGILGEVDLTVQPDCQAPQSDSDAVACWLAGADHVPEEVVRDWAAHGVSPLPAGRGWEAVQVPAELGRAVIAGGFALGMGVEVGAWPVICAPDAGALLLSDGPVLVPAPTQDAPCMADGEPVANPSTRCDLPGPHWLQPPLLPPVGDVVLADPDLLAPGLASATKPTATTGRSVDHEQ